MVPMLLFGLLLKASPVSSTSQAALASVWQSAHDTADRLEKKDDVVFESDFEFDGPTVGISGRRKQKIVGFGSAFTEAAASTFAKLPTEKQEDLLQRLFGPDGLGFTVGRVHINSCDFSIENYNFDSTDSDLELNDFDDEVTHDKTWLLPLITRAQDMLQSRGESLKLLASPWSPPAWMKNSEQMDGSDETCLKEGMRPTWANYFSKWIAAYKKQGVQIWAVTVQNEPGYAAPWEACTWSMEEEADFLGENLGPTLARDHPEVKIFAYDHNKDYAFEWAKTIYGHETAAKFAHGIAIHWYSGDEFDHVQQIHETFPDALIMGSEATFERGAWEHGDSMMREGKWSFGEGYAHDIMGDIKAGASGWIDWNMLLDEDGGPNHVDNVCDAAVISDGADFYLHPQFYYMGHFSKWVLPDSEYIETYVLNSVTYSGEGRGYGTCNGDDGLQAASFMRPDNKVALVVLNCGDNEIDFKIKAGEQAARVTIPAHAIQTYLIMRSGDVVGEDATRALVSDTPALVTGQPAMAESVVAKASEDPRLATVKPRILGGSTGFTTRTGTTTTTTKVGATAAGQEFCTNLEFFNSEDGASTCPPGTEMVTETECRQAGPLNDPFHDDSSDDPSGCFEYLGAFYWNTGVGGGRAERRLLCKKCREPDQAIWALFTDGHGPLSVPAVGRPGLSASALIAGMAGIGLCGLVSAAVRRRLRSAMGDRTSSSSSRQGALLSYAPLV